MKPVWTQCALCSDYTWKWSVILLARAEFLWEIVIPTTKMSSYVSKMFEIGSSCLFWVFFLRTFFFFFYILCFTGSSYQPQEFKTLHQWQKNLMVFQSFSLWAAIIMSPRVTTCISAVSWTCVFFPLYFPGLSVTSSKLNVQGWMLKVSICSGYFIIVITGLWFWFLWLVTAHYDMWTSALSEWKLNNSLA